jgi:hypothetical protein
MIDSYDERMLTLVKLSPVWFVIYDINVDMCKE